MKISELYIYPIKSLRPCAVQRARLRVEGVEHDRRFMLLKVVAPKDAGADGASEASKSSSSAAAAATTSYKPVQVVKMPEAALFSQRLVVNGSDHHRPLDQDEQQQQDPDAEPDTIEVTYNIPETPVAPSHPSQSQPLLVPLQPTADFLRGCAIVDVSLMGSRGAGYRMGDPYDAWFSACLGYEAHLVYVGDFQRKILAHLPGGGGSGDVNGGMGGGLLPSGLSSTMSSYFPAGLLQSVFGSSASASPSAREPTLVYNESAPFLVTNRASLRDFSRRFEDEGSAGMDMTKFRPNIVVDEEHDDDRANDVKSPSAAGPEDGQVRMDTVAKADQLQPWEEDYWAELVISPAPTDAATSSSPPAKSTAITTSTAARRPQCTLELTANCGRCNSINVDYATGRTAKGEQGTALKKLMRDRRVDVGEKYTPIFGRYGYLVGAAVAGQQGGGLGGAVEDNNRRTGAIESEGVEVHVGDEVVVTRRNTEHGVWAWPKYKD
ncbi:uncharacterized protein B0I36DRAFT_323432 [Microdochium trichocladiopsis]|uniref:MOSC domain-containing protein n=1 Tax=Microdochium trichocladiopsis TaxID=1682393 RepID=A0A9P9BNF7_9PEZI|nr:uncharacterized protein B0I36DRAFT_323432 [Microdochium trichocladiopsis]KAH7031216.1 hypothetical protein B0I36DRAFT_323432 [Microdochium trichocladiopsis]